MKLSNLLKPIWWAPYNNTYEQTSEKLYAYAGARDDIYRDPEKRYQIDESTEIVNHPDDVLPRIR